MRSGDPWSDRGAFVVFGAAGGAGAAVAQDLLDRGARVVMTAGTRPPLDTLQVAGTRSRTGLQTCDVTDPSSVEEIMQRAATLGRGRIAGVVLCTGSVLQKPAHRTLDAEWRQVVAHNLDAAFYVARAAARSMRNGGAVVFCAAAPPGPGSHDAVAAALAGIGGLTRSMAATYAHRGLRYNAIVPGADRTGQPLGAAVDRAAAQTMARIAGGGDLAGAVRWLLDPANDWVTGHVLAVGYPSALSGSVAGF